MEEGGDIGMKEVPLHEKIGLTLKQFNDSDIIKPHERAFVERFIGMGNKIKWIVRIKRGMTGYLPTNDFVWNGLEWELKKPKRKNYRSVKILIQTGVKSGKKNYILDFGNALLKEKVARQLGMYNLRNREKSISRLFVVDREGLKKIVLKRK